MGRTKGAKNKRPRGRPKAIIGGIPQVPITGRPVPSGRMGKRNIPIARLAWVEEQLRKCRSHYLIEQDGSKQFGVTRRTIRYWIMIVYQEWEEISRETRPFARIRMLAAFEDFYLQAMERGIVQADGTVNPDYKAALQALDRLSRLEGCYEPEKLTIETTGSNLKSPDAIKSRIAELLKNPEIAARLDKLGIKLSGVTDGTGQDSARGISKASDTFRDDFEQPDRSETDGED